MIPAMPVESWAVYGTILLFGWIFALWAGADHC